jgi:cell division septal protein FtsQ
MPIALCSVLLLAGLAFVAAWPGFDPRRIDVRGNRRVASSEILARAAIAPHVSIWLQNTRAMRRRIEAIPDVATASVRRIPPATIAIAVSERAPYVLLNSGANAALVDRELRVLSPEATDADWPVFVVRAGSDLSPGSYVLTAQTRELRASYDALIARALVPTELSFDKFGGLIVTLRGGVKLLLGGQNDFDEKITLAKAILGQIVGAQRRVSAIDLRAPGAPVLVYR